MTTRTGGAGPASHAAGAGDLPAVIALSSHVARGAVGNRAGVFALERMGFSVWSVPTVVLPWHVGHGPGTRILPPAEAFAALLDDLAGSGWLSQVGAIATGYFGDPAQVEPAAALVTALKRANPRAVYLCDPVIGDAGRLYQPDETIAAIRDRLLPLADIATPNRFELAALTDRSLTDNAACVEAARALGPATVICTSAFGAREAQTGNLMVEADGGVTLAEHRRMAAAPNGTGDLFSASFLGRWLKDGRADKALQGATATVFEVVARSIKRGADELTLQIDGESLVRPMAMVQMRRLATVAPPTGGDQPA